MATRHTLPYFAPDLPAPLPSVTEILASKKFLSQSGEKPVVYINGYAVKYGIKRILQEGENLLFVQESTTIPVPKVYALFHDKATDQCFLVMERIYGKKLQDMWNTLGTAEKRNFTSQLRRSMDELRTLPSPGYYGGIWRQPNQSMYHYFDSSDIEKIQETEEQWADAMCRRIGFAFRPYQHQTTVPRFRRFYRRVFSGHKPVFTHGDFFHNIMIRDNSGVAVIIDWESAGWKPSYWEYCFAVNVAPDDDDWGDWIPEVFDEYVAELGWMMIHNDIVR
jgi:aminoglycoside phosphotransferase